MKRFAILAAFAVLSARGVLAFADSAAVTVYGVKNFFNVVPPVSGVTVTLYLASNKQILDSQVTDINGNCTLTDNAFVGQLRCLSIKNQNFDFYWNQDGVFGHILQDPFCFNNFAGNYYAFEYTGTPGKGLQVIGGAEGYVNPNHGEQASVVFIPPRDGIVNMRIYTLHGKLLFSKDATVAAADGSPYALSWNARDLAGQAVPSGIYIAYITGAGINDRAKIAVVSK